MPQIRIRLNFIEGSIGVYCSMVSLYVVLSLFILFSSVTENLGSEDPRFSAPIKACIWSFTGDSRTSVTLEECKGFCLAETRFVCKSIEYHEDDNQYCSWSKENKASQPQAYQEPCEGRFTTMVYLQRIGPEMKSRVCSSYTSLTDSWRRINYVNRGRFTYYCDRSLAWGSWYRFTDAAGTKLPTAPAPVGGAPGLGDQICGTHAVAWIKGGNPTIRNPTNQVGIVTRDVCFEWNGNSCWAKTTVRIAACRDLHGDYFVYQLQPVFTYCYWAYCAID